MTGGNNRNSIVLSQKKRRSSLSLNSLNSINQQQQHKRRNVHEPGIADGHTAAAISIQRGWRRYKLHKIISDWQATGITVESLKAMSFDQATHLMQQEQTTRGSESLLQALLKHTLLQSSDSLYEKKNQQCKLPGHVFVSGFLFAAHPRMLVTGNSHLDAMIESSAISMTQAFTQFITKYSRATTKISSCWYERQQAFVASFRAFYTALESWKRSDSKLLLATMERHYLELDHLWQTVQRRTQGEGDEMWRLGIQRQREDLLSRIRTLGGSNAVEELLQRQIDFRKTYNDPQPSQTPSLAPPSSSITTAAAAKAASIEQANGKESSDFNQQSSSTDEKHPSVILTEAATGSSSHNVDRILGNFDLTARTALQNADLAHQLVLDPDFRLEPAATNTLVGAVQKAIVRAFFDHIKHDIETGNKDHVIRLLTQLRIDLQTIIPPGGKAALRESLDKELDEEWMGQQLQHGALDIREKFGLVLHLIREVCAPIRDGAVDGLVPRIEALDTGGLSEVAQSMVAATTAKSCQSDNKDTKLSDRAQHCIDELLSITQDTMNLIRDVRLDALNYQLHTVVRPWLQLHAVEYERAKVARLLESESVEQVHEQITGWMSKPSTEHTGNPKQMFLNSFLDLCFAPAGITQETAPLPWSLDFKRIHQMQNELQILCGVSALCTLYKGLSKDVASSNRQVAKQFLELLRDEKVTLDKIAELMSQVLVVDQDRESVERLVSKTLGKDDPMYKVIEGRLRSFVLDQLDRGDNETPGKLAQRLSNKEEAKQVSATLGKTSLDAVEKDVIDLLLRISRLCAFNWQVYSPWYNKLI